MKKRAAFWTVFLSAALATGSVFWKRFEPLRTNPLFVPRWAEYNIKRLADKDVKVAAAAWFELDHLYYTKWAAVDVIIAHVHDPAPIHFLILRENEVGAGSRSGFIASEKPINYGNPPPCRTVGEALMSIVYREKLFKVGLDADWESWWQANQGLHLRH